MTGMLMEAKREEVFLNGICADLKKLIMSWISIIDSDIYKLEYSVSDIYPKLKALSRCRYPHPHIIRQMRTKILCSYPNSTAAAMRLAKFGRKDDVFSALGRARQRANVEPIFDYCLSALKARDANTRYGAVYTLGRLGDSRVVEYLIGALKDQDAGVGREAIKAMGLIGDDHAVKSLIAIFKSREAGFRLAAAQTLGATGNPVAIKPLIAALQDDDEDVRRAAARALGSIRHPQAVQALVAALKHEWHAFPNPVVMALWNLGGTGVELLIAALMGEEAVVRSSAAEALRGIGDKRAVEPLLAVMEDKDRRVRSSAASALGNLRDVRAIAPLMEALKDEDANVRGCACYALGEIGDMRAVNSLKAVLSDRDRWVCEAAAYALKHIGNSRAIPVRQRVLRGITAIINLLEFVCSLVAFCIIYILILPLFVLVRLLSLPFSFIKKADLG